MSFSYGAGFNLTIDAPRFLVADTVDAGHIFEDEEITMAYRIETAFVFAPGTSNNGITGQSFSTPSYRRAAACLLDGLASNRARLAGAVESLDTKVDLGKIASAIAAQAKCFREVDDDTPAFAMIEQVHDVFTWRERVWKQWLRTWGA